MTTLQFTEGSATPPVSAYRTEQLLPNLFDGMASTRPEALYAIIPKSYTSYDAGYRHVTYRQMANAINGVAWLLSKELGPGKTCETLSYVGPNDIGYVAVILGAVKAGYSILSVSPRNTQDDHASLFAGTKCKTLLTRPPPFSPTVVNILASLAERPRTIYIPTIYELLDGRFEHFPFLKTFKLNKSDPLVIVHTSGTTNTPKPVIYTHALVNSCIAWAQEPAPPGYLNVGSLISSQRTFVTFPFFHAGSLVSTLVGAVANQTTIVTPLGGVPPSIQMVVDGLRLVDVNAILLPAPFMEQLSKHSDLLELVTSKVTAVGFGGGDISQAAGDAFAAKIHVLNFNGSTETTSYPLVRPVEGYDVSDWKYLQPHPCANIQFEPTPQPDLFEAVLHRNSDPALLQPVFTLFPPSLTEYRTRDLWSRHPRNPNLWLFRGRSDDMINAATGEMCNPLPLEQAVARHPDVAAALMVGTGRYQKALLVEPLAPTRTEQKSADNENDDDGGDDDDGDFLTRIWPTVQAANEAYPAVSRIARSHILVTRSEKPLLRAGKGTVQRAPSVVLYTDAIDRLYAEAGDGTAGSQEVEPYEVHFRMDDAAVRT